jgi:DNA polymerase III delta prime subunit
MLELTANEIQETVYENYIGARSINTKPKPLLFLGPSGVGKTVSVQAAARSIAEKTGEEYVDYSDFSRMNTVEKEHFLTDLKSRGKRPYFFVDLLLLSHEPADFSGIPRESEINGMEVTKFVPMEWAMLLSQYPGMVFLDELSNVNRDDLRGVAYKLLDEGRTGSIVLSPETQIVAAGNRPDDSSVALPLPAPLLNRMDVCHVKGPQAEEWYKYAADRWPQADPFLLGYLSKIAAIPVAPDAPETLWQFPTPRACESLLKREYGQRTAFGDLSVEKMNKMAVFALGGKEGEILAGWWSRRKEIVSFLSSKNGEAPNNEQLSPAALWAVGIYVGRVVDQSYKSGDAVPLFGLDATVKENMGPIIQNITKHGKEYAVPIYLGMNAFSKGSDPRESACKVAYAVSNIGKDDSARMRFSYEGKHADDPALSEATKSFRTISASQYFSGDFAKKFAGLMEKQPNKAATEATERFVSVGERLLADQTAGVLKELEKVKGMKKPLADAIGNDFAESILSFDSTANWQEILSEIESGPSAKKKPSAKGKAATELITQATRTPQQSL